MNMLLIKEFRLCPQTLKGAMSETRIEKRIVISGDTDIDHDQVSCSLISLFLRPSWWFSVWTGLRRTPPGPRSDPVSPFKALAAALSEARRQHPELSVTRVVIHKETEVFPDHVTSQVTGRVTGGVHGRAGCCMAACMSEGQHVLPSWSCPLSHRSKSGSFNFSEYGRRL